jgi:transcriptional regulator with XRE-family HTH domain
MSSTNENVFIGERLLAVRKANDLSQKDFADSLGLSARAYQNYERGEREISKELIRAIFEVYRIDPVWLILGEGGMIRNDSCVVSPRVSDLTREQLEMINHLIDELAASNGRSNAVKEIANSIQTLIKR